ncbi:MAG: 23S rRNA (pseudouridine(1915)-N(3))-methyltransferase RlmH, partial [Sphingomonadaceae bacterium]
MQLPIIARGKIGRSPEADLVDRYLGRIQWKTKVTELPDEGGSMPVADTGAAVPRTVVLDERGKTMSSVKFANLLGRWRDEGVRETRFLIGAADGHAK